MKTCLVLPALLLLSTVSLRGTPDRSITVEEDFFGSNETGFAILRTETDNHGSYYSMEVTRYLDEYEKVPGEQPVKSCLARRVKRTTLLAVHNYNDPPTKEETIKAKDTSIKLAELLTQYPKRATKWEASYFAKFSTWKKDGYFGSGNNEVIRNWDLENEIFGLKSANLEWKVEEAMKDMNSLYLRVTTGIEGEDEGSCQSRWICIIPSKTRQIHDHLELQPFYLCTGSFATAEEAVKQAREIIKKTKDAKTSAPALEVWSVFPSKGPRCFTIALPSSMENIEPEKFNQFKLLLGPDLSPTSSRNFIEKIQFSESP